MDNDKTKDGWYRWFAIYPWLFSIVATALVIWFEKICEINICSGDGFRDLLTAVVTFVSVVIGLLGVLLTCLITIRDTSKLVKYFLKESPKKVFQNGIKQCILSGLLLVIMTCALFIWDLFPEKIFIIIKYGWVFLFTLFTTLIYRFISMLISLVIDNGEEEEGKKDNQDVIGERQEKMDERIPKVW